MSESRRPGNERGFMHRFVPFLEANVVLETVRKHGAFPLFRSRKIPMPSRNRSNPLILNKKTGRRIYAQTTKQAVGCKNANGTVVSPIMRCTSKKRVNVLEELFRPAARHTAPQREGAPPSHCVAGLGFDPRPGTVRNICNGDNYDYWYDRAFCAFGAGDNGTDHLVRSKAVEAV